MREEKELSDETMLLIGLGVLVVCFGGVSAGAVFGPVKQWLTDHQILVTGKVMVLELFGTGAGLDWPRILIAVGAIVIVAASGVMWFRSRRRAVEAQPTNKP